MCGDERASRVEQSDIALLDRLSVVNLREDTKSEIAGEWIRAGGTYGVVFQRNESNQRSPRHAAGNWRRETDFAWKSAGSKISGGIRSKQKRRGEARRKSQLRSWASLEGGSEKVRYEKWCWCFYCEAFSDAED